MKKTTVAWAKLECFLVPICDLGGVKRRVDGREALGGVLSDTGKGRLTVGNVKRPNDRHKIADRNYFDLFT